MFLIHLVREHWLEVNVSGEYVYTVLATRTFSVIKAGEYKENKYVK